jgi:GDP-L-fucose synthase
MKFEKSDRIAVTGGAGFLGSFVIEKLRQRGYSEVFVPRRREYDLTHEGDVARMYEESKPEVVLHLAR